ncbi:hypothetical protein BP5796_07028 [Coleophoma crateriformis]|uniref:ubiquitinyl hydrolase 1 n=1 Tax=Coleophoma crateriformis TaxID=565419 RepID=A0A3D8RQ48_9HELO|nr:hypothetical protein BP5796_07028 [Coleophoma crateriformis]
MNMMMGLSVSEIEYMIHHVILPPQLPQEDDWSQRHCDCLLQFVNQVLSDYSSHEGNGKNKALLLIREMAHRMTRVMSSGVVDADACVEILESFRIGDSLPLHIREQNAGLILRRTLEGLQLDSFEASPLTEDVITTRGALIFRFPTDSIVIPWTTASTLPFRVQLARFLADMSTQSIPSMSPVSVKAGREVAEIKDTANPTMILHMAMNILVAYGVRKPSKFAIVKRVRDDVLWKKALLPWRRNPLWLLVRVGLQTSFEQLFSANATMEYKKFMAYLMCRLCQTIRIMKLSPDFVSIASAKIARRVAKLGSGSDSFLLQVSRDECEAAQMFLQADWKSKKVACNKRSQLANQNLYFEPQHTHLKLPNSRAYIKKVLQGPPLKTELLPFVLDCRIFQRSPTRLPGVEKLLVRSEIQFALADLQHWVEHYLDSWTTLQLLNPRPGTCSKLGHLLLTYFRQATHAYKDYPDQLSVAMLTSVELWKSLDRLVITIHPLLKKYSPDIPLSLFEPLLLTKIEHLDRLHRFELYLANRHSDCSAGNPSVFSSPSRNSFTVRYFDTSVQHQLLKFRIEEEANRQQDLLKIQHGSRLQQYRKLRAEFNEMTHEDTMNLRGKTFHDPDQCDKCVKKRKADGMCLNVYEWPLPNDEINCLAAVVELALPESFAIWRDVTYEIQSLGRPQPATRSQPQQEILHYSPLTPFQRSWGQQVTLASRSKTFVDLNYRSRPIESPLGEFFVPCGLVYESYHAGDDSWLPNKGHLDMRSKFDYCQNMENYKSLHKYTQKTTHETNEVVSDQSLCPPGLSLHEFVAYGSIRSGINIQWINILRELTQPNMSWRSIPVYNLIFQAVHQVEERDADHALRKAHRIFLEPGFCQALNNVLETFIKRVQGNWNEINCVAIAVELLLKIMSFTSSITARSKAGSILRKLCGVTMAWTEDLITRLSSATTYEQITKSQHDLIYVACICRRTFDQDETNVPEALTSDDDVSCYIKCAIVIENHCPNNIDTLPLSMSRAIVRDRSMSHRLREHIAHAVLSRRESIDRGIKGIWHHYHADFSVPWQTVPATGNRWLATRTKDSQELLFDLLTGQLLVEGHRLGRLPEAYSAHSTYKRVFGNQVLDVLISSRAGMKYVTQKEIQGFEVSFAMQDEELIVQTRTGDQILELIPYQKLRGDLPNVLVEEYTHWMDLTTHKIELRPLDLQWQSSPLNWQIRYGEDLAIMNLGTHQLVDGQSQFFRAIAQRLAAIEYTEFLHVTYSPDQGIIIRLPRYNFHFRLTKDMKVHSPELNAVIDPDQDLGTLYGLQSKLVLKNTQSDERSVLIPIGAVKYKTTTSSHTVVYIDTAKFRSIRYCHYHVEPVLHRLRGPPNIYQGYYLAYLHALTAHILHDPLTGLNGTEQALVILRQACMLPTEPLKQDEIRVLEDIAGLAPKREFYPPHLQKMQSVYWDPGLSVSSQHDEFVLLARRFYTHSLKIDHFFGSKTPVSKILVPGKHDSLLSRARVYNASHRSYEFGGNQSQAKKDKVYALRNPAVHAQALQRVYEAAYILHERPTKMEVCANLWEEVSSWHEVSGPRPGLETVSELIEFRLPTAWTSLYHYCQNHGLPENALQISFVFGTIALTAKSGKEFNIIQSLIALIVTRPLSALPVLPGYTEYSLWEGCNPVFDELRQLIKALPKDHTFGTNNSASIARDIEIQSADLARYYMSQWPCEKPTQPPNPNNFHRLELSKIVKIVDSRFASFYRNDALRRHITELQVALDAINKKHSIPDLPVAQPARIDLQRGSSTIYPVSLLDLFECNAPDMAGISPGAPNVLIASRSAVPVSIHESRQLVRLLDELRTSGDLVDRGYGQILRESQIQYLEGNELNTPPKFPWSPNAVSQNKKLWKAHMLAIHESIVSKLQSFHGTVGNLAIVSGIAPKIQIRNLLTILGSAHFHSLSSSWQKTLLYFVSTLTQYQRIVRLQNLQKQDNLLAFYKESEHGGQEGWSAERFPSWIVFEADNNMMIRPIQARVAQEMLLSENVLNSVLQLNMGDGKSSVIMPIVILSLSDGERVARAVVLESLSKSMTYILRRTIGHILNRPIFFLPFSRSIRLDQSIVTRIMELQQTCLNSHGVLLTQPEYLLSFTLTGVERLWAKDLELASSIFRAISVANSICWDVVDECDAILVDNQLIYTVGAQQVVQGGSGRWKIIQEILTFALAHAAECKAKFPEYVELSNNGRGNFPTFHMSDPRAGVFLASVIAEELKRDTLLNINFTSLSSELKDAILSFARDRDISPEKSSLVHEHFRHWPTLLEKLLIIRGFLAHEILYFLLESKRWRVDYGLYPKRCRMAVPYLAKDVPSSRAEFGHPDIALGLTCLSYYYHGLNSEQLMACFHKLRLTGDPSIIYQEWVRCSALPELLHSECNVNLEDELQWSNSIYPGLRRQKLVVDFYLNHYIFPQEAVEFPKKLPASGWDIPSSNPSTRTVGFSGTNDSNSLLPLSIVPRNIPELVSTGARMLTYSLYSTNTYICAKTNSGNRLSVVELLRFINEQHPKVTVLLDAGAQVLELKNRDVVENWLNICHDADGAIYYDEHFGELTVLHRDGSTEPLISSIYNETTDRCLVYLDQVRTRGTDLKFPPGTRAAVTISRHLGKDTAMQAFMRLRDFGHTHSVLVLAPPEVDREIRGLRDASGRLSARELGMSDVLRWLFKQTIQDLSVSLPGWVEQGLSYRRRKLAADKLGTHSRDLDLMSLPKSAALEFVREWEEEESRSIETLYSPSSGSQILGLMKPADAVLARDSSYQDIINVGRNFSLYDHDLVSRQQRYEREVELEVEIIRDVKRPPKALHETPSIHVDIISFVRTGQVPLESSAVMDVPKFLGHFSIGKWSTKAAWSSSLWVTIDFATTIKSQSTVDDYANPVSWILASSSSATPKILLVISAFEANALLDYIRCSESVCLHVYAPNLRKSRLCAMDSMLFFNISGSNTNYIINKDLHQELAVFAGRLYLNSYLEYRELLDYIGKRGGSFRDLVRGLLEIRRKGEDISLTHMGKLLDDQQLTESDFK